MSTKIFVGIMLITGLISLAASSMFLFAATQTTSITISIPEGWAIPDWGDYMAVFGAIISVVGIYTVTRVQIAIQKSQFEKEHQLQLNTAARQEYIQALDLISSDKYYYCQAGLNSLISLTYNGGIALQAQEAIISFIKDNSAQETQNKNSLPNKCLNYITRANISIFAMMNFHGILQSSGIWITNTTFINVNFTGAIFRNMTFVDVKFKNCDMNQVKFFNNKTLNSVKFERCDLTDFGFEDAPKFNYERCYISEVGKQPNRLIDDKIAGRLLPEDLIYVKDPLIF